jgi:hypothetical protein
MPNKLITITNIIDQCSKEQLESIFASLVDLPHGSTPAEMLSYCINKELAPYGFQTYTSPDKTMVLVNDEGMSKILNFLNGKEGFTPHFTEEQVDRLQSLQKVATKNDVNIYWEQFGPRKIYYQIKQYAFNGVMLHNLLVLNTENAAAVALSSTRAAPLTMSAVVALSWSGSLFFSTLENFIPNTFVRTKAVVCGLKYVTAFPLGLTEFVANTIIGTVEYAVIGTPLPTNVTAVFKLNKGPRIKDLPTLRRSVLNWISKTAKKMADRL